MQTYYDPQTSYSITTDKGEIVSVQKRRLFKYENTFLADDNYLKYALMGIAHHSGKNVNHMVRFLDNKPSLVNLSGAIKMGILQNYSVCDKNLDVQDFVSQNFFSFFTPETELMPILGFVVKSEKLNRPKFSFYENINKISGFPSIYADDNLPGDNLGQMCQVLCKGLSVKNSICTSALINPFWGKCLCLKPYGENPVAIMAIDTFNKHFKGVAGPLKDIAHFYPIPLDTNEKELFGNERINVFIASEKTQAISNCIGFVRLFSNGEHEIIFSQDGKNYDHEAAWNGIF